ncbi:hypothetical protein J6590_103262 [Homalodisca vitripennis]|nr:hypothetical protein J6590_103262 [Homalodisca vitripennis]
MTKSPAGVPQGDPCTRTPTHRHTRSPAYLPLCVDDSHMPHCADDSHRHGDSQEAKQWKDLFSGIVHISKNCNNDNLPPLLSTADVFMVLSVRIIRLWVRETYQGLRSIKGRSLSVPSHSEQGT